MKIRATVSLLTGAILGALAIAPAAHAHSYYNLTGAGTVASGDSAVGFGIANSINGTDGVSNNSNGTNRTSDGTNGYNIAGNTNSLISGTGSPASSAEVAGNLPYMWYSGQHTTATGVTKRELFTGSSVSDNTGNLTNVTGTGAGNSITLPNGTVIAAPSTGTWGTNNVAGEWNAYNAKNSQVNTGVVNYGPIMADLPANSDHPYLAVAGNSASTGLGLDYGLVHVSCGGNTVGDNCTSAGDIMLTISLKNDSDYAQYNGLLDVALYKGVDQNATSDRSAAYTNGASNPQGSSLGNAIWTQSMSSINDLLYTSLVFTPEEWAATEHGWYTLIVGAHDTNNPVAYDVLVTTSAAPVPVPATVWLLGGAVSSLGLLRRRARAAS